MMHWQRTYARNLSLVSSLLTKLRTFKMSPCMKNFYLSYSATTFCCGTWQRQCCFRTA